MADIEQKQIKNMANAYFDGLHSDLLEFGGTLVTRLAPLRKLDHHSISEIFDVLAVLLARKYQSGELDYETADWLANNFESDLFDLLIERWPKAQNDIYPSKWLEVYEAFDTGEHSHFGRSKDPVKEFTDPAIEAFLLRQN